MTDTFNALSAADRGRTLFVAVGKSAFASSNDGFCKGAFPVVMADDWWSGWGVAQRDVAFMRKDASGIWETYCLFSMNSYTSDFSAVVQNLLQDAISARSGNTSTHFGHTTSTTVVGTATGSATKVSRGIETAPAHVFLGLALVAAASRPLAQR